MRPDYVIALIVGVWLIGAAWAIVRAARWALAARQAENRNTRMAALLATSPAAYMLIARDGRVSVSRALPSLLGCEWELDSLDDVRALEKLFHSPDVEALVDDIISMPVSGRTFSRLLHSLSGQRILRTTGRLPSSELAGENGVVVWFADVTAWQHGHEALMIEAEQTAASFSTLSAMMEAAPFPIWHRGPGLDLSLVNRAYVQAVEAEDAHDVLLRGAELFEPGHGVDPVATAARAQAEGRTMIRTLPAIVGGERRMFRICDVPLSDGGVAGFAFDVEDLEQARHELVRFWRAQRETLDRLSAGVAQFAADRTLVFFNQPFARMFALEPEWLAERPEFDRLLERMREMRRLPEQRDFPSWRNERREWFTSAFEAMEETWALPEGSHLRVLIQPHPDGGLLLIFEDRTEQFRLASARDTLLRVQAATLDNLFEAVCVFAANGRLQLWNARFVQMWGLDVERLQQYPPMEELISIASAALAVPERAEMLRHFVRSATTDRRPRNGRFSLKDGRHLEFGAVPLPDGNALFTMLDITDSRRIETALRERNDALEAADRLKSSFVANMSYELRTPLTSILGFAEMMRAGYLGELSEKQVAYIGSILEAAAKLQGLIDNILDLTAAEIGLELTAERVDVAAMMDRIAASRQDMAAGKGIGFSLIVDGDAGVIECDRRRVEAAICHLVSNALAFTPAGGKVSLQAHGDRDTVVISVSDSGIGIPPEEQQRIFQPFNQMGEATGVSAGGLGLALVRRYVDMHHGRIALDSSPGEGTKVTIILPRERSLD